MPDFDPAGLRFTEVFKEYPASSSERDIGIFLRVLPNRRFINANHDAGFPIQGRALDPEKTPGVGSCFYPGCRFNENFKREIAPANSDFGGIDRGCIVENGWASKGTIFSRQGG